MHDSAKKRDSNLKNVSEDLKVINSTEFENKYVHEFYNIKSKKFSDSRVKAWPYTLQFMEKYVKKDDLILDAGCGNGRQFIHPNIIGLDFSENLLLDAISKPNIGLIKANIISLPFKMSTFDIVLSIAVIHHLSTQERRVEALKEIKRVLKPNGICLLYLWHMEASNKAKFSRLQNNEFLVSWRTEMDKMRYYCLYDEEMLKLLVLECGLEILEISREQESIYAVLKNKIT